jgi:hypothetical protein
MGFLLSRERGLSLERQNAPKRGLINTGLTDRGQRIIKALATSAADEFRGLLERALRSAASPQPSFDANGSSIPSPQQDVYWHDYWHDACHNGGQPVMHPHNAGYTHPARLRYTPHCPEAASGAQA